MKTIITLLFFLFTITFQAQFLKKLAKKVSKEAEETVIKKTSEKTSDEIDKSIDGIFSVEPNAGAINSTEKPKATYTFKYLYTMQVVSDKQNLDMNYYMQPNSNYMGISMSQNGMQSFSVLDYEKSAIFNFIEHQGQKMQTALSLDTSSIPNAEKNSYSEAEYTVTDLPKKNILGFSCDGKQLENKERKIILYYTDEMEVNFAQLMQASKHQPNSTNYMDAYFPNPEENMLLYMETTEKKGRKKNVVTMECTAFDVVNKTFKTSGYQSFGN